MADFFGDPLVVSAVEVDLPAGADHDAHRSERSGPGYPQLRGTAHVADVRLPPEYQDVEVVGAHLSQGPFAAPYP